MPGCLIQICGLPGSGKTTLAKRLEVERNAIRMCPDDWIGAIIEDPTDFRERDRLRDPVENLQWHLTKTYLRKGLTVILEFGVYSEEERSLFMMGALEIDAEVELYYTEATDSEKLWDRVAQRNARLTSAIWVMTREEHDRARRQFEPPTPSEMQFYDQAEGHSWQDS
jgi:predicted kinase